MVSKPSLIFDRFESGRMSAQQHIPHFLTCPHRGHGLFCNLDKKRLMKLQREKVVKNYKRGQVIFHEGTPSAAIHCIYSGLVKLYKVGRDGQEIVIRLLKSGEVLGFRALCAHEIYSATAQVVEDTTVCTVTKETLFNIMRESPELAIRMLSKLAVELRVSEDQLVSRVLESVPQRTARLLISLIDDPFARSTKQRSVDLPLRRDEMAQIIGTTPETLSRILKQLKSRRIIELDRRLMTVRKPRQLQRIADRGLI